MTPKSENEPEAKNSRGNDYRTPEYNNKFYKVESHNIISISPYPRQIHDLDFRFYKGTFSLTE